MQKIDDTEQSFTAAVICAAGSSSRMRRTGSLIKKEYCPLPGNAKGLTVLGAAVAAFASVPEIQRIVIAVPDDPETGEAAARNALPPYLLEGDSCRKIHFVPGGKTRQASVLNALSQGFPHNAPDFVLIHDGARPWVSPSLIMRVIAGTKKYRAAVPLVPLTETPKETDVQLENTNDGPVFIKQHLRRAFTGAAQTPQGFVFKEILAAHLQAAAQETLYDNRFTDDAEIWGAFQGTAAVIPGDIENKKITFPQDLLC